MKNKYNTLKEYIYEYSNKEYRKKTVNGLFRAILDPVISNQKIEACVLIRLKDTENKKSLIQRLTFSNTGIYSFNDTLREWNLNDCQKDSTIWANTEFIIILAQRYSAAMIWDYSQAENQEKTDVCLLYNSKIITDISKRILENSNTDFSESLTKYSPDRRENTILNKSINILAQILDDNNEEIIFKDAEKNNYSISDDTLKTAQIVSEKAKFIAHEIKNNLSVINLYSKILEKRVEKIQTDEQTNTSINNAVSNITNSSEKISSLISDLRCISSPYLTEINIKKIILNTIMQCNLKAQTAGVTIEVKEFKDYIITTDKTKFECALMNIIYNAIESSTKGCKVIIDLKKEGNFLKVYIKNNGEKIPDEIKNKIFETNFTTKEKGNGLGLTICKNQLEMVGGNISLVKSDDKETVFEISLRIM